MARLRVEFLGKLAQSLSWRADALASEAQALIDSDERAAIVSRALAMDEEAVRLRRQLLEIEDLRKLIDDASIETYMLAQGRQLLGLAAQRRGARHTAPIPRDVPAMGVG